MIKINTIIIDGNYFYYDTGEFTEEEIKALNLKSYVDTKDDYEWQVYKTKDGEIVVD